MNASAAAPGSARESFSLDGLTESELMTATLTAESRSQFAFPSAKQKDAEPEFHESSRAWLKPEPRCGKPPGNAAFASSAARDTSQFVSIPVGQSRDVPGRRDVFQS